MELGIHDQKLDGADDETQRSKMNISYTYNERRGGHQVMSPSQISGVECAIVHPIRLIEPDQS